jgi:hypothetical protein
VSEKNDIDLDKLRSMFAETPEIRKDPPSLKKIVIHAIERPGIGKSRNNTDGAK